MIPLSKSIGQDQEPKQRVEAFCWFEVDSNRLGSDMCDSTMQVPTVIRNVAECPYPVEDYTLCEIERMGGQSHVSSLSGPDIEALQTTSSSTPESVVERDWHGEREQLLQQAQEEAEHYLMLAQEQAEALKQEARIQGLKEAEDQVRQEMTTQYASVLMSLQQALAELADVRLAALRAAEQDVVDLAFSLARKIVHHDVRCNRQVIRSNLRQALTYLVDQDRVVIHVNPADLDQAQTLRQELDQSGQSDVVLDMQPDATVGLGGCIIHSQFGTIDARIETQFDELLHAFEERLGSEEIHP